MKIYGEITKVEPQDDGTIRVQGIASSGSVDDADETVRPEAMKAALPAYMRFGALREMHGLSAAGATLSAEVGKDGLTRIEAHVVDPVAVKKVRLGVYKGFSIGGKVLERDPNDRKVITKLKLDEISLVDRPCNPDAVVEMWKADLVAANDNTPPERRRPAPTNAQVVAKAIEMAIGAGKPGRHTDFVVKARQLLLAERLAELDYESQDKRGAAMEVAAPVDAAVALKIGARNSQADLERIQAAHDLLAGLGARCDGQPASGMDDGCEAGDDAVLNEDDAFTGKALVKALAFNLRLARRLEASEPRIEQLTIEVETLWKRLAEVAAQPVPPRAAAGSARAITKTEDADPGGHTAHLSAEQFRAYLDGLPEEERGQLQLRAALQRPVPITIR